MLKFQLIIILSLFINNSSFSIETFKLEENIEKYLVGTVSVNSSTNEPKGTIVLIEGIKINDVLILPLKLENKEVIIRRRDLKRIKLNNGIYFVYRIPIEEIKPNKLNTLKKKIKYIKDKISFVSGEEPTISLSGNTYEDYAYFKVNDILTCDIYITEILTNKYYFKKLSRTDNTIDFNMFIYDLYTFNIDEFVFILIDPNGRYVVSDKVRIDKNIHLKIYSNSSEFKTKIYSELNFTFRTFNPDMKPIEYTIDWGDLWSDLETYTSTNSLLIENFSHTHKYEDPDFYKIIVSVKEVGSETFYIYEYQVEIEDTFYLIIEDFDYTDKLATFFIRNLGGIDSEPTYILLQFVNGAGRTIKYRYDFDVIGFGSVEYFEVDMIDIDKRKLSDTMTATLPLFE